MKQTSEHQPDARKLAIVGPSFFGYLETLQKGFRGRGINTQFFDERWSNTVISKMKLRFLPKSFSRAQAQRHHCAIYENIVEQGTTHVLVISSELFPVELLRALQAKGIQIIAYCFDSFTNKPHMREITAMADAAASFDPEDCKDADLTYIPLYSNLQINADQTPFKDREIDFLYFGTLHSNRPYWISRAKMICEKRGWSGQFLLYFHNKVLWYLRFAFHPSVWKLGHSLSTQPFPSTYLTQATMKSKVVVDIHHPDQTGMTMRVFEALSCGCVVVSTNPNVETTLPETIAEKRVRSFTAGTLQDVMTEALGMDLPGLAPEEKYYLSAERYIDQLSALIEQATDSEMSGNSELIR